MLITFTHHELMEVLDRRAKAVGGKKRLARMLGVGPLHLERVMGDRCGPSMKLLNAMNLRKVTFYQEK